MSPGKIITLQWTPPLNASSRADSYSLAFMPKITQVLGKIVSPIVNVTIEPSLLYSVTLSSINCKGSTPTLFEIGISIPTVASWFQCHNFSYICIGYSVHIEYDESDEMSADMQLEFENGDSPSMVRCVSNANMPLNLTWTRNIGSGSLPNGITQRNEFMAGRQVQHLTWNRNVKTSDGGVYVCSSSNTLGDNTMAQLTIVVQSRFIIRMYIV